MFFGIINNSWFLRDSLDTLSDACFIYADAILCLQLGGQYGAVSIHIAETIYFLIIFIFRSICIIHLQIYSFDLRIQRHINNVSSVLTNWLDASLAKCIRTCSYLFTANTALLEVGCSFYGLFTACVFCFIFLVSYR